MIKADRTTQGGKDGKDIDLDGRDKTKSKTRESKGTSGSFDGERDENGKFKDWPVAGTVFD